MKYYLLFFVLTICTNIGWSQDFRKNAPAPGPAPKIEIGSYETFTLDNGLKVIVVENHKIPKLSVQLYIDAGLVPEGDKAGKIDMAGGMISRGTKTRTKAQIDAETDFIGASLSSSGSGLFGTSLKKHSDKLLTLMSDVLLNPTFPQEEFEKLKTQTLSGLESAKDDPNTISDNVGNVLTYGKDHPYGEVTSEASVLNITLDDCKMYYQVYFKPNISYLVFVGDINRSEAEKYARQYFASWQKGVQPMIKIGAPEPPTATNVMFVNKPGAVQSVININYPVDYTPNSPDNLKIKVMNTLLGGFFRSRINDNLREKKGYTYGAGSSLSSDKYVGSFSTYGSFRNEVSDSALTQILFEMERIRSEKVEQEELDLVKNVMSGNFARSLESPQTIAQFALNTYLYSLPKDYYQTYLQNLSKVSAEDVSQMAKKYIHPDKANILIVGNKSEIADKFKPFSSNGTIAFYDYYGTQLPTNGASVPAGLTAEKVIENYINAIGGEKALREIKDRTLLMETNMQGMSINIDQYVVNDQKFAMQVKMQGMVLQSQVFDGNKGTTSAQGQTTPMEEEDLKDMKAATKVFTELYLKSDNIKAELAGIESVEGKDAYQVNLTYPDGKKSNYFYDIQTWLKVREIETSGSGDDAEVTTTDLKDYQEVDGIQCPHTLVISGPMPVPMTMKVKSISFNSKISDDIFKLN